MKNILYACLLMMVSVPAIAQKNLFSHGADLVIPQNALTNTAKTGWGTSFSYERVLGARLNATAMVSFMFFGEKTLTIPTQPPAVFKTKATMIPVQVGLKFFLIKSNETDGLFVRGETGIHVLTAKGSYNGIKADIDNSTNFSYALGVGYRLGRFELAYKQQFVTNSDATLNYSDIRFSWFLRKT